MITPATPFSFVLETPAATPEEAHRHFLAKLSVETDAADLHLDLERGKKGFVVVDVRSPDAYAERHIPGALNLPARTLSATTTAHLSKDDVIVTYCWSPGCNGSTKAAARLSALGFRVKELIGGIEYWVKEGYATEGTAPQGQPVYAERLPR
ncbi:rhodanese-like domain-containing protein [Myxococcus sp. CA040A]|uniref:rhodanese-like domain-containing protein n=1 Tax=Myxococcus sp. CA040A TaxID=2741738 RepID=UPI00157B7EB2|nr:rhodanese-like domain-containing protein [Myxococcus sp. CA040A]NTX06307.1 rhodanese-like domain-containing protein [Myxococcus sp. CA040A]